MMFDLFLILSVIVLVIRLSLRGAMTVEQAGTILVLFVAFLAISRRQAKGIGSIVTRIGLPILSLGLLLLEFGIVTWGAAVQMLAPLAMLVIVLYGFFIMFGGLIGSKKR